MSVAWDRFVAQYNAQGPARLEGYHPEHFAGLTEPELALAQQMVLARADALETPEIRALALLRTPEALRAVEQLFQREGVPGLARIAVCEAGWAITGDPEYQHALFPLIDHGEASLRARALTSLCAMSLTPVSKEYVRGLLPVEASPALAVQLAKALLREKGVAVDAMSDFVRELPTIRAMTQADLPARAAALARFDAGERVA